MRAERSGAGGKISRLDHGDDRKNAKYRQTDFKPALVDWWVAVCLNGDQLHRPADTFSARAILEAAIRMEQSRLRDRRHRISSCLFSWTDRIGAFNRSHRHTQGTHDYSHLVFDRSDVDVACSRSTQLCSVSLSARCR